MIMKLCARNLPGITLLVGCMLLVSADAQAAKPKPPAAKSGKGGKGGKPSAEEKKRQEEEARKQKLEEEARKKERSRLEAEADARAEAEKNKPPEQPTEPVKEAPVEKKEAAKPADSPDDAKEAGNASAENKEAEGDGKSAQAKVDLIPSDLGQRYENTVVLGYRFIALPPFLTNLFAATEDTYFFHSVTAAFELRRGAFTAAPTLGFTSFPSGNTVIGPKGATAARDLSYIRSSLFAFSLGVSLRYALPLNDTFAFEFGVDLGGGLFLGSLSRKWLFDDPKGQLSYGGKNYSFCSAGNLQKVGCRPQDRAPDLHIPEIRNADTPNADPSQFDRGRKPVFFPWLSLPVIGVRARINETLSASMHMGLSATGFWIGVSGGFTVAAGKNE
jgi:hypothetical protein